MLKKILIYTLFLTTLYGCVPGLTFLGPAISYSKSGNVVQSALSFGSNILINEMKNKPSTEIKKNSFDDNKILNNRGLFKLNRY